MSDAVAILDPAPIAAMLRAAMPDLVEVGTATDFGSLTAQTIRWPSAFVITLAETAGPNTYQSDHILKQRVLARFGVVWAVRDLGDLKGSIAAGDIRTVRMAGMSALCRFAPEGAQTKCEPVSGRLVSSIDKQGQMLWQDDFTVAFQRLIPTN